MDKIYAEVSSFALFLPLRAHKHALYEEVFSSLTSL